ncbi:MAG TPA: dockerin type I domain-containing protein [Phycisphaerae bacterium]|nr:dockerin type I domain-containing protein [Phycisphaerae bacterium]
MKVHGLMVGIALFVATAAIVQAQTIPQTNVANSTQAATGPSALGQPSAEENAALVQFIQARPEAKFYQQGGKITRIYGTPLEHGATPGEAAEQFRTKCAAMLGVSAAELMPVSPVLEAGNSLPLMYDPRTGEHKFTLVYYSHYRDGIPVFRSDVRMLVRNVSDYPVVWVGSTLRRLGDFHPDQSIATAPASVAAMESTGMTNFSPSETVIWAGVEDAIVEPVLAVTFVGDNEGSPTATLPERWRFVADAATGAILYRENMVITTDITGNVSGKTTQGFTSDVCGPEAPGPMAYAQVSTDTTTVYADSNGNFTIPNDGSSEVTVQSPMRGQYFHVTDIAGPLDDLSQSVTPPGPANFMHNEANTSEWVRAQINGYVSANVVHDYVLAYSPAYPGISTQLDFPVRVNRTDGYCPGNAWFDGHAINFCMASMGYPNTAYSGVVYHEYGHNVVQCGGSGQDQYGEGMSDCIACLITDDHWLAMGFTGDCSIGLRDADNDYQYPCSGEAHDCGNLISGCVWSTRNELRATNPTLYRDILSSLTINSVPLHSGELITPQITIDFLTLDDNDGDLSNGTPHAKEICAGFGAHNMGCPAGVLDPIDFQYPGGRPTEALLQQQTLFQVNIVAVDANPVSGTGQMHYSIDGGPWTTVAMTETAPNQCQAVWPALPCHSEIDWYVTAQADDGSTYSDPIIAPVTTYAATVGRVLSVAWADNFEHPAGWTAGDVGDDATSGIWECAAPEGTTAQPSEDHSPMPGQRCWVTGAAAGASPEANSVHGGKTTLMSPTLDLSGQGEAAISYWRWYSNDQGPSPGTNVFTVDISNDNGSTWTNAETVGPTGPGTSGGWIRHAFRVADFVSPTAQVKIRFVAAETGDASLVEAAVDDFQAAVYQCDVTSPTPNPPAWAQPPSPISTTAISMQASASDPSGVEYYFSATGAGSHTRTWGASATYIDGAAPLTPLQVNRPYFYKVKARDGALPTPNETAYSANVNVATFIETPTALTFGTITDTSIQVTTPGTFTRLNQNVSGLYFEVTGLDGTPAGSGIGVNTWTQLSLSQTATATGLLPGTTYRFRVKARNYYGVNETPWYPATGYMTQTTTGIAPCIPCGDLNHDGAVNYDDYALMRAAMGHSASQPGTDRCADADGDGLITLADFQAWVQCYRQYVGDQFAPLPTPGPAGDVNGDGVVDGRDIEGFVNLLLDPTSAGPRQQAVCDFDGNGVIDAADVPGFIAALTR